MRRFLFAFLITVAVVIGGALIYAATQPDTWSVERSTTIAAPPDKVYPHIATPSQWPTWSAWNVEKYPSLAFAFEGPDSGVGAVMSWTSEEAGNGSMMIVEAEPGQRVKFRLEMEGGEYYAEGLITLTAKGEATEVTWLDGGKLTLVARLFRGMIQDVVGQHLNDSLTNLKRLVETGSAKPPAPADPHGATPPSETTAPPAEGAGE